MISLFYHPESDSFYLCDPEKENCCPDELGVEIASCEEILKRFDLNKLDKEKKLYAIGDKHSPGEYGMWYGPIPDLKECIQQGGNNTSVIFEVEKEKMIPLYQWSGTCWVPMKRRTLIK